MQDVSQCFMDGYSTAGSPGTGLGAIQRLSSYCEVFSDRGQGTALLARLRKRHQGPPATRQRLAAGAVTVPIGGEHVCGDGYAFRQYADFASVLMVDGLGHGPAAADCAIAASAAFEDVSHEQPAEILAAVHGSLRSLRGAAAAAARLDFARRQIIFAGLGNIAALTYINGVSRQMISHPGIVGHDSRNVREVTYDWPPGSLVLLYSDGIQTRWSLESYGDLWLRDPSLIAGVVYRDFARGRDDASVLVIREESVP